MDHYTSGTYTPSWEVSMKNCNLVNIEVRLIVYACVVSSQDIGPAMLCSVVSVIVNVILVGGAVLYSRKMLMAWIVWDLALLIIFWGW